MSQVVTPRGAKRSSCLLCGQRDIFRCPNCAFGKFCSVNCADQFKNSHKGLCPVSHPDKNWPRGGGPLSTLFLNGYTGSQEVQCEACQGVYESEDEDRGEKEEPDNTVAPVSNSLSELLEEGGAIAQSFAAGIRLIEPFKFAFWGKSSSLSLSTKSLVGDTLKELGEDWTALGMELDALDKSFAKHFDGSNKSLTSAEEAEIRSRIEKILEKVQSNKQIPAMQARVKQVREATEALSKRIIRETELNVERAKNANAYDKAVEAISQKQKQNAAMETELAELKKKQAALEQKLSKDRSKFTQELSVLRQQNEETRSERKAFEALKKEVEDLNQTKKQMETNLAERLSRIQALEKEKQQAENNLKAAKAEKTGANVDHEAMGERALALAAVAQSTTKSMKKTQEVVVAADTAGDELNSENTCAVCHANDPNAVLLLNCVNNGMHVLCERCLMNAYQQSKKNGTTFKYHICPVCHEEVTVFDGHNIAGEVVRDASGISVRFLKNVSTYAT